jgi:hypothetical protein
MGSASIPRDRGGRRHIDSSLLLGFRGGRSTGDTERGYPAVRFSPIQNDVEARSLDSLEERGTSCCMAFPKKGFRAKRISKAALRYWPVGVRLVQLFSSRSGYCLPVVDLVVKGLVGVLFRLSLPLPDQYSVKSRSAAR